MKPHITKIHVVKRTFEGKDNPNANDNPITSKYMPSKKYAMLYECEEFDQPHITLYETKKLAEIAKENELKYNINCIKGELLYND